MQFSLNEASLDSPGWQPWKNDTHEIDKAQRAVTRQQKSTSHGPLGLSELFRDADPGLAPWAFECRPFGPKAKVPNQPTLLFHKGELEMTTRRHFTACGLLAAVMIAANGCGESAAPPAKQVAKTDDHANHKDGDGHDHGQKDHDHSGWWCGEHGLPEAVCSICSKKVADAFKAKGDWCDEHERAKSQCFICDPKLQEKFAAQYRAKEGKEPPAIEEEAPKKEGT